MLLQILFRTQGVGCCYGFVLNERTGKCDKCPLGYYGNECSEKCFPPTYGEDCQSLCNCPVKECHFVNGCVQRHLTSAEYTKLADASSSVITVLNVTSISYPAVVKILSTDVNKVGGTTLVQTDLLKNNIIIGFIGFFVISFFIFVLTYMYFKCFRKATQTIHVQEVKAQAQYKSLNFDPVEQHSLVHLEPPSRFTTNADSMYLSPVFSRNESSEQRCSSKNEDILQETTLHGQEIGLETSQLQNKQNLSEEDEQGNVYIEITESSIEKC